MSIAFSTAAPRHFAQPDTRSPKAENPSAAPSPSRRSPEQSSQPAATRASTTFAQPRLSLATQMDATDKALAQGVKESKEILTTAPVTAPNGGTAPTPLSTESRQKLQAAASAELDTRARYLQNGAPSSGAQATPSMATYQRAAQSMLSRHEGQPAQQALLKNTLDEVIQQRFQGDNPGNQQASVQQAGNTVYIRTGNADDRIHVSQSDQTGQVTVDVNGQKNTYTREQAQRIDIQTAGGDDTVRVDANVKSSIMADGGAGNDTIYGGAGNDRLLGGSGNDTLIAGDGHDYVDAGTGDDTVSGGRGNDTLYGGEGHDQLDGGTGDDYLDGYLGNDRLTGGAGNDVLSGGQGDDRLDGSAGNDVIYAGKGSDQITDLAGSNKVYHQADDKVQASGSKTLLEVMNTPSNISIQGSAEFKARTQADLETLAASPAGQQMLQTIEKEGRGWLGTGLFGDKLTITEMADDNGYYIPSKKEVQSNPAFHLGNPEDIYGRAPPIMVLYHEMGHAQADMNGTSIPYNRPFRDNTDPRNLDHNRVPDEERRNVGLPRDHDNNPNTKAQMDPNTPYALTENGLREEMGYVKRGSYVMP